jgi:hypothetical protein
LIKPPYVLQLYKPDSSLGPQFEKADVVIDFGASMGTRAMADVSGGIKLWQVLSNGL